MEHDMQNEHGCPMCRYHVDQCICDSMTAAENGPSAMPEEPERLAWNSVRGMIPSDIANGPMRYVRETDYDLLRAHTLKLSEELAGETVRASTDCRICGCVAPHSHNNPDANGHYHWVAVDFDGTLTTQAQHIDPLQAGEPNPKVVAAIKDFIHDGIEVRVFTARVSKGKDERDIYAVTVAVQDWCEKHIGHRLPVTNIKAHGIIELWDDRAVNPVRANKESIGLLSLLIAARQRAERAELALAESGKDAKRLRHLLDQYTSVTHDPLESPNYSQGLLMFPFADKEDDKMQSCINAIDAAIAALPAAARGE